MNKFIIIDPSLKSYNGHFLTYDNSIAIVAKEFGFQTTVISSQNATDLPCEFDMVPKFRYELEHDFINTVFFNNSKIVKKINKYFVNRYFFFDFESAVQKICIEKNSLFFIHTTTYRQIIPLIKWVKKNKKLNPIIFIMLRYAPSPNPYYPFSGDFYEYRLSLKYLEESGVSKYFRLIVDSDLLQEEYSLITDIPVQLVPIPHTMYQNVFSNDDIEKKSQNKLLTYLGNARSTKGFQYLPYLIEKIQNELKLGEWEAEFQANVMFLRDRESVISVSLMRNLPVKLLEKELSLREYESLLKRSSLVLIPYQLLYYYSQTSGVFCEALGAGKPVVVPRGTWMANQLKGKNIGVTFIPGDRVSFTDATIKAMKNIFFLK